MSNFTPSDDPLTNAVHQGIKRGIDICIMNECWGSALILIYSAIDTMAFLGMPKGQPEVKSVDFRAWADKYIRFPGLEQVTGLELWGARCGVVHCFGSESRISREGKGRQVGYVSCGVRPVSYDPSIAADYVQVSLLELRNSLFKGIDNYLVDLFANKERAPVAEARLQKLFNVIPPEPADDSA